MQKTGGVSLYMRMQRYFGEAAVYPNPSDGEIAVDTPQLMIPRLLERWAKRRDQIRAVAGHFPLCTLELLDAEFRTFTVLRDPVERTLSYLRHHRELTPADSERPLEEIYDEPRRFRHFIENHMVKMLSLRTEEMRPTAMLTIVDRDRSHLDSAKEALADMDAFGFQEDLEAFAQRLERLWGWRLGPPRYKNTTTPAEVPDSLRRRIAEDNRLDMELYEYAQELARR
jgi:Sulfotransferase family